MVGRMILVFNVRLTMITSSNKRQLTSRKKIGSRAMIVENHKQDTVKGGAVY